MRGKLDLSYAPVNGLKQGLWKDVADAVLLNFWSVALWKETAQRGRLVGKVSTYFFYGGLLSAVCALWM